MTVPHSQERAGHWRQVADVLVHSLENGVVRFGSARSPSTHANFYPRPFGDFDEADIRENTEVS
jgi:hypothetical protein